ncbi:4'-phosphopantetheinyl transferase family protein [Pedobacter sp. KBW06]|uniref:4'-phosphopantetheinyl transferase family protein n=1 Tax=Pedobacter sp. KBW06 TaxID=2153359 RepID=UPI0013158701|nr:4'-phosphopantetheinyl transferase superfamily protein [Pedobacter sp. KBW06]
MEQVEKSLLTGNLNWVPYSGQGLSATDFVQVFKISAGNYFRHIDAAATLSATESAKASRFPHQQSRENYTVRKYLLRQLLSRFLQVPAAEIVFQMQGNKKPIVDGVSFNVSHTKDHIVMAFSESAVGIDVEYIDAHFQYREVIDTCFSPAEADYIENSDTPLLNFYTLWTRKEALLKASAEGLVDELNKVPSLAPYVLRNAAQYKIDSHMATKESLLSIAVSGRPKEIRYWDLADPLIFF